MTDDRSVLKSAIEHLSAAPSDYQSREARHTFLDFRAALTRGEIRAAEKVNGDWMVNPWVKQGILLGFRLGELAKMSDGDVLSFVDKDTFPARRLTLADQFVLCQADRPSAKAPTWRRQSSACLPCS